MKIIFLTGPKHSGKTATGGELASLFSCDFADLDELILRDTGFTSRELYNQSPDIFRKAEAAALANFIETANAEYAATINPIKTANNENAAQCLIMATGGGIIDNSEAVGLLKKSDAVIIYLNVSTKTAWNRIVSRGELPPFLKTDNPKESHRLLHERRSSAYEKIADIIINAENKTPQSIAGEIFRHLKPDVM